MTVLAPARRTLSDAEKLLAAFLLCLFYFAIEVYAGASFAFAGLMAVYVGVVMLAIRAQGGIKTIFGVVVFWFASQHVLFSQLAKVAMGENPEQRLNAPLATLASETLLMLGFATAGVLASAIQPNRGRPLFPPVLDRDALQRLAVTSATLAVVRIVLQGLLGGSGGGPFVVLGSIDSLAIGSAVAIAVTHSGGKRLTNPLVWAVTVPIVFFSIVSGGRQGFVTAFATVAVAGWAFGYHFRFRHFVAGVAFVAAFFFIISPYSLAVRSQSRTANFTKNFNTAIDTLEDVIARPAKYQVIPAKDLAVFPKEMLASDYYGLPPGNASNILNRYSLIKLNSMIVEDTIKHGTSGWTNIAPGLPRLLPSFLSPEKSLLFASGNALSHRVRGISNPGDYLTGITIGITADSFSAFAWPGVFLMPMAFLFVNLVLFKFLTRMSIAGNVFAVAIVLPLSHFMSELVLIDYLGSATYNLVLYGVSFFVATRVASLGDFRHLRPRARPSLEESETTATAR